MSTTVTTDRAGQAGRASYRDVFGLHEFSVIFAANIVSMLGTVVAAVALTVLVYEQTRSPALAASVMTDLIHHDPLCFRALDDAGLPQAFLNAVTVRCRPA